MGLVNYYYLPRCAFDDETAPGEGRWLKRYKFQCTGRWLQTAVRKCTCSTAHRPLMDVVELPDGRVQRNGRTDELEASGWYPKGLGVALVTAWAQRAQPSVVSSSPPVAQATPRKRTQPAAATSSRPGGPRRPSGPAAPEVEDPWAENGVVVREGGLKLPLVDPWGSPAEPSPASGPGGGRGGKRQRLQKKRLVGSSGEALDPDPWS